MKANTYLTFKLGQELFAVNVDNVLEVLERQLITPVPDAPKNLLGIINFRGEILPVLNTHLKFNLTVEDNEELERLLIVFEIGQDENKYSVAATADAVKDVIEVANEQIKPVPENGISYDSKYLTGITNYNNQFVMLLNTIKAFSF
ncbi:MAG TPA: chemotaxis protein CheW [Bacteroidales bacterium]|nr:chemotaxis protein CheW [Bacteroidales bacterium]